MSEQSVKEFIPEDKLPKPIKSITFSIQKSRRGEDMLRGEVEFVDGNVTSLSVHMMHTQKPQEDGSKKDTLMTYEECQHHFFESLVNPWAYETFEGMSRERYDHLNAPDEVKA